MQLVVIELLHCQLIETLLLTVQHTQHNKLNENDHISVWTWLNPHTLCTGHWLMASTCNNITFYDTIGQLYNSIQSTALVLQWNQWWSEETGDWVVPGTDAVVVDVSGNDDAKSTQSRPTVKHDRVLAALVQPRLYRLAHVTQTLQRWRQCVWPTEVQHLPVAITIITSYNHSDNEVHFTPATSNSRIDKYSLTVVQNRLKAEKNQQKVCVFISKIS